VVAAVLFLLGGAAARRSRVLLGRERIMRSHDSNSCHLSRVTCPQHITYLFLRYILIRSLAYTSDRARVRRIAAGTLAWTSRVAGRLGELAQVGVVIEMIERRIGRHQRAAAGGEMRMREFGGEDAWFGLGGSGRDIVRAINRLSPFEGQLLVLRHIEGFAVSTLARIFVLPPQLIRTALVDAEREFVEQLRDSPSWRHGIEPDVHGVLAGLARTLDADWTRQVVEETRKIGI
jgi:hypothetical protein